MSRKGMLSVCKSKQIPRIFQRQRGSSIARTWSVSEDGISSRERTDHSHCDLLPSSSYEYQYVEDECDKKRKELETTRCAGSKEYSAKTWSAESCQVNDDSSSAQSIDSMEKTADAETVASIEKWLKVRTESMSSMDLDGIKSEVDGSVPGYLGEDLSHTFLEKDSNPLSIDIDLSDKKLNLSYYPILHELQNEKLLGKDDEFSLPEFQLDPLDPLELTSDMMVAGEILPSASALSSLNVVSDPNDRCMKLDRKGSSLDPQSDQDLCEKSTQVYVRDLNTSFEEITHEICKKEELGERILNYPEEETYLEGLGVIDLANDLTESGIDLETKIVFDRQSLKTKIKGPGIIKKRKKLSDRKNVVQEDLVDSNEGIMAVVAISTDKLSNLTHILINNGIEEQIYQGKTSELIEATGNLPIIDSNNIWIESVDSSADNMSNNQHDLLVTNALKELGITDESLQPVVVDQGKMWICPWDDCSRQFNRLFVLKGHLLAHYGVKPFKCDFEGCAWAFQSEFKLKRHRETHLKRKDYVCEVKDCQRRFTTIYNLLSHKKLHSRPNRIVCHVPDCQEKFQTKRALEVHMKSHDQSHAPYVCKHEGCGKRYYSSNALTSHQRCHSYKETDIKCSWPGCGKIFDKPCRLKAHTRSHTGCKPYPCTFQGCQWAFASSSKLKRHQKKHTNDRKFVCDIASCGKAFMRSEHLKEHRLTHSEGRYFQCYICESRFSAKSSLYVHIKKHQSKIDSNQTDSIDRMNPVLKQRNSSSLDDLAIESELQTEIISQESFFRSEELAKDEPLKEQKPLKTLYRCPVESCTRSYTSKSTLRTHTIKMHSASTNANDESLKAGSTGSSSNSDYELSTPYSVSEFDDQIIISSLEADILGKPESPKLDTILKRNPPQRQTLEGHRGSARTNLTCADVWKLKSDTTSLDSIVGATDVILGSTEQGLLLVEDLTSSMYFQDDIGETECQVMLLDSGPVESTINLRGLE